MSILLSSLVFGSCSSLDWLAGFLSDARSDRKKKQGKSGMDVVVVVVGVVVVGCGVVFLFLDWCVGGEEEGVGGGGGVHVTAFATFL